jgi:hypothetical protein
MFVQRFDTNYNGLLEQAVLESARVLSRRVVVLALGNNVYLERLVTAAATEDVNLLIYLMIL